VLGLARKELQQGVSWIKSRSRRQRRKDVLNSLSQIAVNSSSVGESLATVESHSTAACQRDDTIARALKAYSTALKGGFTRRDRRGHTSIPQAVEIDPQFATLGRIWASLQQLLGVRTAAESTPKAWKLRDESAPGSGFLSISLRTAGNGKLEKAYKPSTCGSRLILGTGRIQIRGGCRGHFHPWDRPI